jgi:amidohydrolase
MTDVEALKQKVSEEVDRRTALLLDASHRIHAHPELGFEEHHAHDLLTSILADAGLDTERGAYDVATGFRATAGTGRGPVVAILCEYDALPEIGHACGHNVIASAGIGAALAAATVAEVTGGRLVVMGTPAEEGGGGKIVMARRGAFDGVDAALMIHPADADLLAMSTIAVQQVVASYDGKAAHAAAFPWEGRNALDAAVLGYMNVAALRQHILPTERVHGVFTKGGDKPNIVPKEASTFWFVRSPTLASLEVLKPRVLACLEAGATASGCTMHHEWDDHPYAEVRDNPALLAAFAANASRLGRTLGDPDQGHKVVGSTDMGNVSYLVPSIHPMLQVAPAGIPIHSPEFARYAGGEEGDRAVIDGAKALAMTVVDLWAGAGLLDAARADFAVGPGNEGPARAPVREP